MRQLKFLSILLLLTMVVPLAALADSFKVLPVDLELGKTGTLQFVLENTQDFYGFQADVKLPDGLTAGEITLSNRATKEAEYQLNSNTLPTTGLLRFGAFSVQHKPFVGNSGEVLAEMEVTVAADFNGGDVELSNVKFISAENKDVKLDDSSSTLGIAVTGIELKENSATLKATETVDLSATVKSGDVTIERSVTWESDNTDVATVDATSGKVTAVSVGKAVITAKYDDNVKASCTVTVIPTPVVSISFIRETLTLKPGGSTTLVPNFNPETATDQTIKTWTSSNPEIATVDEKGVVAALKDGETTITATSNDGEKTATCVVTVKSDVIDVTAIFLDIETLSLTVGETDKLTATLTPEKPTDPTINWSSDKPAVASVDKNGNVTAVTVGTATITAEASNGLKAYCTVTVKPILATSVKITAEDNKSELKVDETVKLTATVAPENTTDKTIFWSSSDENVATVKGGVVTAVALGEATITASCNEGEAAVSDTFKVTVIPTPAETITLSETELSLTEGEGATLTATVGPADATDKTYKWSSDNEEVATVDAEGNVKAIAPGKANITATSNSTETVFASCEVTVNAKVIEITGISLDNNKATLCEGTDLTLTPIFEPENTTQTTLTWSSDKESVATVKDGVVKAVAAGEANITVTTVNGLTATCEITVKAPISAVSIIKSTATIAEGESMYVIAKVAPADPFDSSLSWSSSDETVATVASNGKVTALKAGTATITATSDFNNAISASCAVTVITTTKDPEEVTISWPMTVEGVNNQSPAISEGAEGIKAGEVVLGSELSWIDAAASNGVSFAKIQPSGKVPKATEGHTVTFSVETEEGYTFEPTGVDYVATVFGTDGGNYDLNYTWNGKTVELQNNFHPNRNNAANGFFSPESFSITDAAAANGKFEVTFSIYNLNDNKQIGLSDVVIKGKLVKVEHPILNVTLDQTSAKVNIGESVTITATVEADDAADKTITWTSSDEAVATVENGVVTGVAEGTATITATAGDKSATCEITVERPVIAVSGITLNVNEASIMQTKSLTLVATVVPDDATDKTVTWSSDNEAVATVDQAGKVTGVALGTANITAKAGEFSATCVVTVTENLAVTTDGTVKMTYVDGTNCVLQNQTETTDRTNETFGEIPTGENAIAGYNKISGGSVGFGQPIWGVNYITYLQVDASSAEGAIIGATLSFEGSGSTDSKRNAAYGVGYNSSAWSADMTYNTADKTITTLGDTKSTSTKSATTFEKFTFDISDAVKNAENGLATILVYATNAAGGYIKNPTVNIEWTKAKTYNVTFTETSGVEGVKVTLDGSDVTNGTELINGTYSFTATSEHYKDYTGSFTVADEDLEVKFEMTPKATWNYTVKNNVNSEVKTGTVYEGEPASVFFNKYILDENGTVWSKVVANNTKHEVSFTPDKDGYVYNLEYSETDIKDGIFFKEAEDEYYTENNVLIATATTGDRGSNKLGGYTDQTSATLYTLLPGTYNIEIGAIGPAKDGAILVLKAGEEEIITTSALYSTLGTYKTSKPVTVKTETDLTIEGTNKSNVLDYILITGTEDILVTGINLSKKNLELEMGAETQLTATVLPADATHTEVTWTTSNENVVKVDESTGKVTAIGVGSAIITAHCFCGKETADCVVKVYPTLGDANMDGKLDITDATDINNYVVGKKEVADEDLEFYLRGANANGDAEGKITVADATATIDLFLKQENPASTQARVNAIDDSAADALVIGRASTTSRGTIIPVALDNTMEYVAFQADIILPEGANVDVKTGARVNGSHKLMSYKFADNYIRIAIINFSNEAIADSDAPVIEIISDSNVAASDIVISNIIASDEDANGYVLGTKLGATTAVDAIGLDGNAPVKVFDVNGMFVGDSLEGLQQGTYIVRQGEEVKKIRIR